MGALQAVSVANLLGDVGTVAGIAAALASAVLAAIVLTQGRELRRLRDGIREESERALAVEGSLTAGLAAAQRPAPQAAAAVPAAMPVAAVAVASPETDRQPVAAGVAPVSAGRPPLGSATPSPPVAALASVPPLAAVPAAAPVEQAEHPDESAGTPLVVIPQPAVPPATAAASAAGRPEPLGSPSTVAAGGIARSPKPPIVESSKRRGRLVPALLGGLVVAGIVVFAVSSIGGDDGSSSKNATGKPPVNPAAGSIVAVLNGTPVSGLAGQVSRELVRDGFKAGRVATARDQQQSRTVVAYMPGHLTDAEGVIESLKLQSAPVPADDAVQAIACPDPSTCNVEVIVTVGSDRTR